MMAARCVSTILTLRLSTCAIFLYECPSAIKLALAGLSSRHLRSTVNARIFPVKGKGGL
jgi:hypothetical protein